MSAPFPTTHVDNRVEWRKIVNGRDRHRRKPCEVRHRGIEARFFIGSAKWIEKRISQAPEPVGWLASSNAVLQVFPQLLDPVAGEKHYHRARRSRNSHSQTLANRRQAKVALVTFR